jgi:hypothetical protein
MSKESEVKNVLYNQLMKQNGKLVHVRGADASQYKLFVDSLAEGQIVDHFMDANVDDGTLAQLAKIHACIRELAKSTGYTFEEMKFEVKKMAGLCVEKDYKKNKFLVCKSFSKCSKDELGAAIEAIVSIGETVGINFR